MTDTRTASRLRKLEQNVTTLEDQVEILRKTIGLLVVSTNPSVEWMDKKFEGLKK